MILHDAANARCPFHGRPLRPAHAVERGHDREVGVAMVVVKASDDVAQLRSLRARLRRFLVDDAVEVLQKLPDSVVSCFLTR